MDIGARVPELLTKHPDVISATLTGSRARGEAIRWSDWDFLVETADFEAVSGTLPALTEKLQPLSYLWDPLSHLHIFMLILKGPEKVDIIFDRPHQPESPWTVNQETLTRINGHFWDWIFWIGNKEARGNKDVVSKELAKMYTHLLKPLGCPKGPDSVEEAVSDYILAFQRKKSLFHIKVDSLLGNEVVKGLKAMGFQI